MALKIFQPSFYDLKSFAWFLKNGTGVATHVSPGSKGRKAQLARCENAAPKPHPHCPPAVCVGRMQQSVKDFRSGRY